MSMMIGEQENYVYIGTDGIYFNIRSDGVKQYILVIIGVASRSNKAFLSIEDGYRESEQSWTEVLLNLKDRGFRSLKLAVGDGALSFWKVERKVLVQTRSQHCWVHETESTLNKFQNKVRPKQNNISMISGWQKPEKMQSKRLVCSLKFTSSSTPKPPNALKKIVKKKLLAFFSVEFDAS